MVSARRWQSTHIWPTTGCEGLAQCRDVARAVLRGADGIDQQAPAGDAQLIEQGCEHLQHFGIAQRRLRAGAGRPDDLRADLEKLAVAALLRALAAELRADVIELLQQSLLAELVLDIGADDAGGVLRPQGERLRLFRLCARLVLPGVHLLGDDVGLLAHAAGEERGVLEDGCANLAEVVAGKDAARGSIDVVPQLGFRRQQVAGAADGFNDLAHDVLCLVYLPQTRLECWPCCVRLHGLFLLLLSLL